MRPPPSLPQFGGGAVFSAVGATTIAAIGQIRADLYFMGVTGIHPEVGLSTGDYEEAQVKRAMCQSAAETIVLASQKKLGAASPYVITPMEAISAMIVDARVAEAQIDPYHKLGVSIIRAQ